MALPLTISSLSKEYIRVPVFATEAGAVVNPTGDTVTMAFTTSGADPVGGDYKTASWEADATAVPAIYYARCVVGPGGAAVLTAGRYTVWVKLTDSPEVPVKRVGELVVT